MDPYGYFNKYSNQFGKEKVFAFKGSDFITILIGYPIWKAYFVSTEFDFSLEVIPKIDLNNNIIYLPEREPKKKGFNKKYQSLEEILKLFDADEIQKISDFINLIPKEIIDLVKQYSDSHWEIIKAILYLGENLTTLIKVNPAVAYIAVNLEVFNSSYTLHSHLDYLKNIITLKQKKILERALFESSEQNVKILSKFDYDLINIKNLNLVRGFFISDFENKQKIVKLLSHQKVINEKYFDLIFTNISLLDLVSINAINEIIVSPDYQTHISTLKKIKSYSRKLKLRLPIVKSLNSMDNVLQTVKAKEEKRRQVEETFPPPWLPGNEHIIPITTKRELMHCSKRQVNCIRTFSSSIKHGTKYIYKVIYDEEEATMELAKRNNKIIINSILAKRNKPVSKELSKVVTKWMRDNRK